MIDYDTDEETDKLLGLEHQFHARNQAIRDAVVKPSRSREGMFHHLLLLIPILSLSFSSINPSKKNLTFFSFRLSL